MSRPTSIKYDTMIDVAVKKSYKNVALSKDQISAAEGILIPENYDRHQIPELYPDEHPPPRRIQTQTFDTEEEREEFLSRKRETQKRYRARKAGENIPYQINHANANGNVVRITPQSKKKLTSTGNHATERNTRRNKQDLSSAPNNKAEANPKQGDPEIPHDCYEIGRPLPPGYRYAEPYTVESRYRDLYEEAANNEKNRLRALDETTMLQPIVEYMQGLGI